MKGYWIGCSIALAMSAMTMALASANERHSEDWSTSMDRASHFDLLADPRPQYAQEGDQVRLMLANSLESDVEVLVEGLPPGLALETSTGLVAGTLGQQSAGRYLVKVTARASGLRETAIFPWYVLEDEVPQLSDPGLVMSRAGDDVQMRLSVDFENLGFEAQELRATNLPDGLTLRPDGVIVGTIADSNRLTSYQVTVQAVYYADQETRRLPTWGGRVFTWVVAPPGE